jgi:VWFA-related protein
MSNWAKNLLGLSALLLFYLLGHAQSAPPVPPSAPPAGLTAESKQSNLPAIFHTETRLVVVDVVITDKHGQPVTNLKESDLTLLEDGKPQQVQLFEPHIPRAQPRQLPKVDLPPNQYTNFPIQAPSSSVNIILFDTLNTPIADQMYARWQMMEFVKALPPGKPVALFTLGHQLRMIAGFTTNSEELVAAATKVRPALPELDAEDRLAADTNRTSGLAGSPNPSLSGPPGMTDLLSQFLFQEETFRTDDRVRGTLDAFTQISRAVAGYSGRKNLLWLSEGFPINLSPDALGGTTLGELRNYSSMLRESSTQLSSSQISVYPIDVRGVSLRRSTRLYAMYDTMDEIAKQTGGKAFYSTNDLKLAMQQSIERGATYYTVAYVPENRDWNSNYRHIKLKFARTGLNAEYRPGYYAVPDQQSPADVSRSRLIAAMRPGIPESTMLLLRVQVLPPDSKNSKVRIDYGVYAPDLDFTDSSDHSKHVQLEFVAAAWDKNHVAAGNGSQTINLALKPEDYEAVLQNGLSSHLELELKPGNYNLRLGVMDDGNQKIGTLDVPLRIAAITQTPTK